MFASLRALIVTLRVRYCSRCVAVTFLLLCRTLLLHCLFVVALRYVCLPFDVVLLPAYLPRLIALPAVTLPFCRCSYTVFALPLSAFCSFTALLRLPVTRTHVLRIRYHVYAQRCYVYGSIVYTPLRSFTFTGSSVPPLLRISFSLPRVSFARQHARCTFHAPAAAGYSRLCRAVFPLLILPLLPPPDYRCTLR